MEPQYRDIQPFYKDIFRTAFRDPEIRKQLEFVRDFFEEWCGNFLHPFADTLFHQGKKANLLYCYLSSESLTFDWLAHTLLHANYHIVLRELRTILENSFLIYSIDTARGNEGADAKLQKIEDLEASGNMPTEKAIFEKSGYHDWQRGYDLYKSLTERAHANSRARMALEISKNSYPEAVEVEYDRESFIQCSELWQKVAQVLVALAIDCGIKLGVKVNELDSGTLFKTM